jgi:predicted dehydrogenase
MSVRKKIALIGCGVRGRSYLKNLKAGYLGQWELSAIADPDREALEYTRAEYGDGETILFEDYNSLYERQGLKLDAAIVATPNDLHAKSIIPVFERKIISVFEKPVANTIEDCAAIWKSWKENGEPLTFLGFVLRYTPFYSRIKNMLDSGEIGQIMAMEANEQMGPSLVSLYLRGWRRFSKIAGPLISEKCSHDIDILNWFAGAPAERVNSFATRMHFLPNKEAASNCGNCKFADSCAYSVKTLEGYSLGGKKKRPGETVNFKDSCVYNNDSDIPDNQSVQILYENKIIANFFVTMGQPRTNRFIRIMGTKGQIEGNLADDEFCIIKVFDKNKNLVNKQIIPLSAEGGHHGGDSGISVYFRNSLNGDRSNVPLAGLREGIESSLICFAAETSRIENRAVKVDELRHRIFS